MTLLKREPETLLGNIFSEAHWFLWKNKYKQFPPQILIFVSRQSRCGSTEQATEKWNVCRTKSRFRNWLKGMSHLNVRRRLDTPDLYCVKRRRIYKTLAQTTNTPTPKSHLLFKFKQDKIQQIQTIRSILLTTVQFDLYRTKHEKWQKKSAVIVLYLYSTRLDQIPGEILS